MPSLPGTELAGLLAPDRLLTLEAAETGRVDCIRDSIITARVALPELGDADRFARLLALPAFLLVEVAVALLVLLASSGAGVCRVVHPAIAGGSWSRSSSDEWRLH